MKRLFSVIIIIVIIISFILFMQPNLQYCKCEKNEIRENTLDILKKTIAAIAKISKLK